MKTAAHPTLKAHLWRFAIISLSLFGVHQNLQAKESSGMRWTVTRHTWGEDLSGTLQGAGGIGGLLRSTTAEVTTNGTPKTEHEHTFSYDSNGNVILLTNAKARETARYSYDAFGKTLTATGPAAEQNRYQFSTKPVEEESGLVYYGYRWYDPITGRWRSRDPIEERGGVNLYGMVSNEVNNILDYLGLAPAPGFCEIQISCAHDSSVVNDASCGANACHYNCTVVSASCNGGGSPGSVPGDQWKCYWNIDGTCPPTRPQSFSWLASVGPGKLGTCRAARF